MGGRLRHRCLDRTARAQTPQESWNRPSQQGKNPCQLRCWLKARSMSSWSKQQRREVMHPGPGRGPHILHPYVLPCSAMYTFIYLNEFLLYFPLTHYCTYLQNIETRLRIREGMNLAQKSLTTVKRVKIFPVC